MKFEIDHRINLDYYNAKITEYGQDIRALSWGSIDSQQERFRILYEIGELNNRSILDVGCGFGDLYLFLKERGGNLKQYVGIDVNAQMIALAKVKSPEVTFEVKDILDDKLKGEYDYVVASGIFSLETPDWQAVTEKILRKMYQLSRIGIGVNFLSSLTTGEKYTNMHYAHPEDITNFVHKKMSTRIVLRHDYRPNDFTLYIYKPFSESHYLPWLGFPYKLTQKGFFVVKT